MRYVLKLGPLPSGQGSTLYLAFGEGERVGVKASSDLEGLRMLVAQDLGAMACEPVLESAAKELGLPVDEVPFEYVLLRATIAVHLANPDLEDEAQPALEEFLQVFAVFLDAQPWETLEDAELLKVHLTKPQRSYDALVWGSGGERPGLELCPQRGFLQRVLDARRGRGDVKALVAQETIIAVDTSVQLDWLPVADAMVPLIGAAVLPVLTRRESGANRKVTRRDLETLTASLDAVVRLVTGMEGKGFADKGAVTALVSRPSLAPVPPEPADPWAKVSRNDLCPCGSGKKFKKCHEGQPLPKQVQPLVLCNVQRTDSCAITPWRMTGGPLISEVEFSLEADGQHFFTIDRVTTGQQLQKISLREQRVVEAVTFDLDVALEQPTVLVEGDRLFIGADDRVLVLSTKNLSPIEQQTLPRKAIERLDRPLDTRVMPGGKYAWSFGERGGLVITELTTMKSRELTIDGFVPQFLATPEGVCGFVPDVEDAGQLLREDGEVIEAFEGVSALGAPDLGEALITAEQVFDDDDELQLVISVDDPEEGRAEYQTLPGLDGDGGLTMISCLDERMVVLQFVDSEGGWVMALARKGDSLETLWRVRVPEQVGFVQDARLRHAVMVARTSEGLRCHRLTREAPPSWPEVRRPPLNHRHGSCPVWGPSTFHAVSATRMTPENEGRLEAILDLARSVPDPSFVLQSLALCSGAGETTEAAAIREVLRSRWGDPPGLALQAVGDALDARHFERAIELLGTAPPPALSVSEKAHWHHLRGVALFALGRFDEAQPELEAMLGEGGHCEDQGWTGWLDAWRGKGGPVSEWIEQLRAGDAALSVGRCEEALSLYDSPLTAHQGDKQHAARIVLALRDAGSVPPAKRRELLAWARRKFSTNLVGAWGPLAWPKEKLDEALAVLEAEVGQVGDLSRA